MPRGLVSRRCQLAFTAAQSPPRVQRCLKAHASQVVADAETRVLDAIRGVKGRGKEGLGPEQLAALEGAVQALEADGGVADPTTRADLLDGRWQLLYTSRPGSASPIQRAFTGTEAFKIFQEIRLQSKNECRVNNVVEFGDNAKVGVLRVEAEASTDSRPLKGFTPRRGAGLFLFGKSQTGPPARENLRIDFQFDKAAFDFRKLPFKIPYPVPFKLLGDETKGWIDITYLNSDGTFRLTRGNKGTLFVLTKSESLVEQLLVAVRDKRDSDIITCIDKLASEGPPVAAPARDDVILGRWRQVWTKQADNANPLQKALSGQAKSWQIIASTDEGVSVENRAKVGFLTVRAFASCEPASDSRTSVDISKLVFQIAGQSFERQVQRDKQGGRIDEVGYVDWLYVDDKVRVTKGSKGSYFVHVRESDA